MSLETGSEGKTTSLFCKVTDVTRLRMQSSYGTSVSAAIIEMEEKPPALVIMGLTEKPTKAFVFPGVEILDGDTLMSEIRDFLDHERFVVSGTKRRRKPRTFEIPHFSEED